MNESTSESRFLADIEFPLWLIVDQAYEAFFPLTTYNFGNLHHFVELVSHSFRLGLSYATIACTRDENARAGFDPALTAANNHRRAPYRKG